MKVLFYFLLSFNLLANDSDIDYCRSKASFYGDHKSPDSVENGCYDVIKAAAKSKHIIEGDLTKPEILAAQNMIYLTTMEDVDGVITPVSRILISGEQSMLKNIEQVHYSQKLERVFILDKEIGAILSFDANLGGNIAPKRKLVDEALKEADDFILDDEKEEMYIVSKSQNWIKVYKMKADMDNKDKAHTADIRRTIDVGSNIFTSIKQVILSSDSKLYILSNENNISVIEKNFNSNAPELLSSINASEYGTSTIDSIEFAETGKSLFIRSPTGVFEHKD